MRLILSTILLAAGLYSVFADEDKVGKYNIGFAAGFTTGYGLSYRQWFDNGYGMQFSCGPYYDKNSDATDVSLSLGVAGLKMIHSARRINLFGYYGTHLHYSYFKQNNIFDLYANSASITEDWNLFTGGGAGLDFHVGIISLSVMTGLMLSSDFKNNYHFGITAETALYYSF